jgi:hypothetical protein
VKHARNRSALPWLLGLLVAGGLGQVHAADVFVVANIVASETWTQNNDYILTQPIYVTNGATLTIEPGTVVRGETESAPGANDPGTLIITRGSKIRALGNIYHPVTFTDLFDDNVGHAHGTPPYDNLFNALGVTEQWGGVILLGRGYVANNTAGAASSAREVQIEGLLAAGGLGLYGNCAASPLFPNNECDDDDSGKMTYVSIRYGGFNLSAANEINGLTMGGVGRSTVLEHIEVFQNKDDGYEFFGGAAQLKWAIAANVGDDSFDYDEGWRGKVQFGFGMQGAPGADRSDKGGEHDGGNGPDSSLPLTIPTFYNMTYVGLGQKAHTTRSVNTALHVRDNAATRYYNSFFADFGGASLLIEGGNTGGGIANSSCERAVTPYVIDGKFHRGPPSDFQLELKDNCWWCIGRQQDLGIPLTLQTGDATAYGGDAGKDHCDNGMLSNAALNNDYLACATPIPIQRLTRTPSGDPNTPDPITSIDPRRKPGQLGFTGRQAPRDSFFCPAPYKGAFHSNWASGYWAAMSRLGYFPVCDTVLAPNVLPDEVVSLHWVDKVRVYWDYLAFNNRAYDLLRKVGTQSSDAASFAGAAFVEQMDFDTEAEDATVPASGQIHYYLVRARNDCGNGSLGLRSDGSER